VKNKKVDDSLLDNLYIASPCTVPWDSMQGDQRKRLCGGCSRNVFNVSDMTKPEAENFLRCNGSNECMVFYRRQDGTILTDDCPVALRKIRDRCKLIINCAAGLLAFVLALPAAIAQVKKTTSKSESIPAHEAALGKRLPTYLAAPAGLPAPPQNTTTTTTPPAHVAFPGGAMINGGGIVQPRPDIQPTSGEPMLLPTALHPKPGSVDINAPVKNKPPQNQIKMHAEQNMYMSTAAASFYDKGKAASKEAKHSLAAFYFEKALDEYDKQKVGDAQFRKLLERSLHEAQDQSKKQ
jgi:hypothetical protein